MEVWLRSASAKSSRRWRGASCAPVCESVFMSVLESVLESAPPPAAPSTRPRLSPSLSSSLATRRAEVRVVVGGHEALRLLVVDHALLGLHGQREDVLVDALAQRLVLAVVVGLTPSGEVAHPTNCRRVQFATFGRRAHEEPARGGAVRLHHPQPGRAARGAVLELVLVYLVHVALLLEADEGEEVAAKGDGAVQTRQDIELAREGRAHLDVALVDPPPRVQVVHGIRVRHDQIVRVVRVEHVDRVRRPAAYWRVSSMVLNAGAVGVAVVEHHDRVDVLREVAGHRVGHRSAV
eukprot:4820178-Pleurochrysis_carterae.AAC.2